MKASEKIHRMALDTNPDDYICLSSDETHEFADEVALLEQVVEAAKRAIAIIYDAGYAAIPTAIDLEEAIDRILDD